MNLTTDMLLRMIGKQAVMIDVLQQQLKEARGDDNESHPSSKPPAWAQATANETPKVR